MSHYWELTPWYREAAIITNVLLALFKGHLPKHQQTLVLSIRPQTSVFSNITGALLKPGHLFWLESSWHFTRVYPTGTFIQHHNARKAGYACGASWGLGLERPQLFSPPCEFGCSYSAHSGGPSSGQQVFLTLQKIYLQTRLFHRVLCFQAIPYTMRNRMVY